MHGQVRRLSFWVSSAVLPGEGSRPGSGIHPSFHPTACSKQMSSAGPRRHVEAKDILSFRSIRSVVRVRTEPGLNGAGDGWNLKLEVENHKDVTLKGDQVTDASPQFTLTA